MRLSPLELWRIWVDDDKIFICYAVCYSWVLSGLLLVLATGVLSEVTCLVSGARLREALEGCTLSNV